MANNRVYFAVKALAFSKLGLYTFTNKEAHGVQSAGINTQFNLEQVFEFGQLSLYENIENIPDIELTIEKVLDGYPPLYTLATDGATSASLSGRSAIRTSVAMSIYGDTQDSASGTPVSEVLMSGMYPSQMTWTFPVDGNFTESMTLVGNNKKWLNAAFNFTPNFDNTDDPFAAEGVNRRQDFDWGTSRFPTEVPGISASGTNDQTANVLGAHVQRASVTTNLGREALYELGRKGPYFRYVTFPVEVRTEIEVLSTNGDQITALEDNDTNVTDQTIIISTTEGTLLDLGTKNKLQSVTYGGGNAGQNGGNDTITFTYVNYNDLTLTHPQDPSSL